ncbi:MAG: hypothetical protein RLZ22_455 [Verrucomicrobiota bacterium]|jgi:hypothetical protein
MNYGKVLTAITVSLMATRAAAVEAPADDAPPPARSLERENQALTPPAAPAPPATVASKPGNAFLGVVSEPVPETFSSHLGIDKAIVVKSLMPDGPAAKAGIMANDIITHIGGQAIQSPDELTRKVTSHQPGEKLRVAIIRKGQPQDLDVTLGQRPNEFADATPEPRAAKPDLNAIPNDLRERARQMLGENFGEREMNFEQQLQGIFPEMNDAMKQLRQHMENAFQNLEAPKFNRERGIHLQQGATFRLSDERGCVEIHSNNGSKEVTVRDKDQRITWSGPWDTAQDKAAAPESVRERIEALNIDSSFGGNGLRLRLGGIPDNK